MNKLILEGKEYTLSDELIKKIKAEVEEQKKMKNPFERVAGDLYYYITGCGEVNYAHELDYILDQVRYENANYSTNKAIMEQRALHETLNRLLWRYSVEHDGEIISYGIDTLFSIDYSIYNHSFEVSWCQTRITNGVVYFKKEETAQKAIEEVIKPFLENHPEFHYFNW